MRNAWIRLGLSCIFAGGFLVLGTKLVFMDTLNTGVIVLPAVLIVFTGVGSLLMASRYPPPAKPKKKRKNDDSELLKFIERR